MEFALGAVYDQLKHTKDAIEAYKRAADLDPEDAHNLAALAQALLNDNQLDAALKQYRQLADADPQDSSTTVHISEILRRQGKYEEALTTIKKAVKKDPDSLEAGYNEGLLLDDVLGRYDFARKTAQVYRTHGRPARPMQITAPIPRTKKIIVPSSLNGLARFITSKTRSMKQSPPTRR